MYKKLTLLLWCVILAPDMPSYALHNESRQSNKSQKKSYLTSTKTVTVSLACLVIGYGLLHPVGPSGERILKAMSDRGDARSTSLLNGAKAREPHYLTVYEMVQEYWQRSKKPWIVAQWYKWFGR